MFKRILVAVDGSPVSTAALKSAIALAADQRAELLIVHVIDDAAIAVSIEGGYLPANYVETFQRQLQKDGSKVLAKAQALAQASGVDVKPLLVQARGGSVADAVLDQSRKLKADVIVLGTHGRRGLRRVLMGSDAETVVRDARVPVLLVRKDASKRAPRATSVKRKASRVRPPARTSPASSSQVRGT